MSPSSLKKSSLRRKDTMWIYKNPQGLQLLENELNERRKKRSERNKSPLQKAMPSPLILSPKPIQPEQVIPVAAPLPSPVMKKPIKITSTIKENKSIIERKQALENKNNTTIPVARPAQLNKDVQPLSNRNIFINKDSTTSSSLVNLRKESTSPVNNLKQDNFIEIKTKPIDLSLLNKYNQNSNNTTNSSQPPILNNKKDLPLKERKNNFPLAQRSTSPISTTTPIVSKGLEARKQALYNIETPNTKNTENVHIKKEVQPLFTRKISSDSNIKKEEPQPLNTQLKTRLTPRVSSLPNSETQSNNFLLEAKQKLFTVQQQQRQSLNAVKRNSAITPPPVKQQNGLVSSFISAFETPAVTSPPPKLPQHAELPITPSHSTPLTSPINRVTPVSSNSSMLPRQQSESYFSTVIDRRLNNISPTGSEESIQLYLPQLSPELSFSLNNSLDVPSSDDEDDDIIEVENERPCIKKRVSFSEQLSTVIPDDESEVLTEDEQPMIQNNDSFRRFSRTLSQELTETSTILAAEKKINPLPREKYIPVPIVKKPVVTRPSLNHQQNNVPQKLSNKLLDMFQKKPKTENKIERASVSPPPVLTHLTKNRPRKPPSLKKPTALAYPAAIAQPDWRTRAIGSKNIYNKP